MKKRYEVLFNQLKDYRGYLLENVRNITAEEAEIVPKGFNNNIRWNLGHVYLDQYDWIDAVTGEDSGVETFEAWFGLGTSPLDFDEQTPTFEDLKQLLGDQINYIKEKYGYSLETEYPPTEMGMHTVEQVLIRTIFHEGLHIQKVMDIKKLIDC